MNAPQAATASVSASMIATQPEPKSNDDAPQPAPSRRSRTVTNEQREEWIDKHMPFLHAGRD